MRDAPDRIWAVPEYNCTVYMSGNSPITAQTGPFEHRLHGKAIEYVRADLSDALLREAMEALQWLREVTEPPDRNCSCHRSAPCGWCEQHAAVAEAHEETRATLAKLLAHLGEK